MSRLLTRAFLVVILLIAFSLRVHRLDSQSLWSDEGLSVTMAERTAGQILKHSAADIHPPLYYLALHYWSRGAGITEFGVRYLSVITGLLLVALTYRVGRALLGPWPALASTAFMAVSPLQVYYSQEARMYSLFALLAAVSTYCFWRLLSPGGERPLRERLVWALGYVASTSGLLHTQYFAFSVVAAQDVFFVLAYWRVWRERGRWLFAAGAQAMSGLIFLPWFLHTQDNVRNWTTAGEHPGLWELLRKVFLVFGFGRTYADSATAGAKALLIALLVAGALVAVALVARSGRDREAPPSPGSGLALLWLLVPFLLLYAVAQRRLMYFPEMVKLALPASLAFYLLLGLGATALLALPARLPALVRAAPAGAWGLACVGAVAYAAGAPLHDYYYDSRLGRDDYRGLASYIEGASKPRDCVLLTAPGQSEIFSYYYSGPLAVHPLPRQRPLDPAATEQELRDMTDGAGRVWAVLWAVEEADPQHFVESWLNSHAFKTSSRWFGGVQLVLYTLSSGGAAVERPLDATFGGAARLEGYSIAPASDGVPVARSGDTVQIDLRWRCLQPLNTRYKVFTHVIDEHGYLWGQHDAEPAGGLSPTSEWSAGETVEDRHGIQLFSGTPPGEYQVEVGLYDAQTGARLPLADASGQPAGDRALFGPITVTKAAAPPDPGALPIQNRLRAGFGELTLLGYDLVELGVDAPATIFAPGRIARLALYWQAEERITRDYDIRVRLVDGSGREALAKRNGPAEGDYPTSAWEEGELVLDQHKLPLDLPPGRYTLEVAVLDGSRTVATKQLTKVEVR